MTDHGVDPTAETVEFLHGAAPPAQGESGECPLPKVPGYTVERELGRGGMGAVYLATQETTKRQVALKVVQQQDDETTKRFRQEVEAAAKMNHPNITTVFEVGQADGLLFFSMSLIEGGTDLGDATTGASRFGVRTALVIVRKIALALHDHKDCPPAQVLRAELEAH